MFMGEARRRAQRTKTLFNGEKRELPSFELDSAGTNQTSQIQSSYMGYLRFLYAILMRKSPRQTELS